MRPTFLAAVGFSTAASLFALLGCGSAYVLRPPEATLAVRGCASSGEHGIGRGAYAGALRIGPLSLTNLANPQAIQGIGHGEDNRYPVLESIALLRAGHQVAVSVAPRERSSVGLLYDKSKFRDDGLYRPSELNAEVVFRACKNSSFNRGISQFDGGVVVSRPLCVELDFRIDTDTRLFRQRIAYGRRCSGR